MIDRCNLTILEEPGQETLAEFLAAEGVHVVASLPCYSQDNVDRQRGAGVFDKSIRGLQKLNALGYAATRSPSWCSTWFTTHRGRVAAAAGQAGSRLQAATGREFRHSFNRLLTITNQPISRFGSTLVSKGLFRDYMALLRSAHRDDNLDGVMCRNLVSVDWRGYLYDCDFNQMLAIPLREQGRRANRVHLADLLMTDLADNPIAIADHCYACTAGQGSSCGGALDG